MEEIGVWGDSIAYGASDSEGLGWVGRLRKKLLDTANIYNRGVCGDTTEDLLKRFATEADSIEPDQIIFAIGINDSKFPVGEQTNKIPFEKFKENLRELLIQAKKYTSKIYVVGLTRVYEDRINPTGSRFVNTEIQRYDDFIKELAELENALYIPVVEVLDIDTDLADGLHPNAGGYEKLFAVIAERIA